MLIDSLHRIWQEIIYGILKRRPNIDLTKIPTEVNFKHYYDTKNKVHWLESTDLPEFMVTGKNNEELARNFHETMMTYFDVPTYFANQLNPSIHLSVMNPKTKKQEQVSVNYREELNRVLA